MCIASVFGNGLGKTIGKIGSGPFVGPVAMGLDQFQKDAEDAKKQERKLRDQQKAFEDMLAEQKKQDAMSAENASGMAARRNATRAAMRNLAASKSGTLLTGPLGDLQTGTSTAGKKTILGA